MPLFVIQHQDKPGALQLRIDTREAHLAYLAEAKGLKVAGPYLNEAGEMVGSMLVVEAQDMAGAEAFAAADPYAKAGLFASSQICQWRHSVGQLP